MTEQWKTNVCRVKKHSLVVPLSNKWPSPRLKGKNDHVFFAPIKKYSVHKHAIVPTIKRTKSIEGRSLSQIWHGAIGQVSYLMCNDSQTDQKSLKVIFSFNVAKLLWTGQWKHSLPLFWPILSWVWWRIQVSFRKVSTHNTRPKFARDSLPNSTDKSLSL